MRAVDEALIACLERPRDLSLAREYLRLVREHGTRASADVCQVGTLVVDRRQELASDERTSWNAGGAAGRGCGARARDSRPDARFTVSGDGAAAVGAAAVRVPSGF